MLISSCTPGGSAERCTICGAKLELPLSPGFFDATCSCCGQLFSSAIDRMFEQGFHWFRKVLTEREAQCHELSLRGYSQAEIAEILVIDETMVREYCKQVEKKLRAARWK